MPDLEEYRSRRGFYMDIEEIPGAVVQKEEDLPSAIRSGMVRDEALDSFLSRYMGSCDGASTQRIGQWMELQIQNR